MGEIIVRDVFCDGEGDGREADGLPEDPADVLLSGGFSSLGKG